VESEYEALRLENTLIKHHSPKYNICLKDGKTYPVIRITAEDFPRVFRTRFIVEDKSVYYGPFPNVPAVDAMLELIDQLFPLRKCRRMKRGTSPCIYYHIGRCMAPCIGKISAEAYRVHVDRVQKLLAGETEPLIIELSTQMHEAARNLRFERAAQLRNAIKAIEQLAGEDSSVVDHDPQSRDYIAWATEGVLTTYTVFSMRGGKMTGRDLFRTRTAADDSDSLELFVSSYYNVNRQPPAKVFISFSSSEGDRRAAMAKWFLKEFENKPELAVPDTSHHMAIIAMARQNALEDLRRFFKERGMGPALDELQQDLNLRARPTRIEGFDVAQLDGTHPVASLISFAEGIPDRKNYRHFKLRSVVGVVDDFAAMREVVRRRYSRLIREQKELPNLVLIDGGIGQVNAAKAVMDELGMDIDIVGLAKRDEELWLPGAKEPVRLSRTSEALRVLQFVRDETHRFATGLNQRLRSKALSFPALESIQGIGPRRAAAIMKKYGSIDRVAEANPAELAKHVRISEEKAKTVRAAAKLAIEDREAGKQRLASGGGRRAAGKNAAALADEALAKDPEKESGKPVE
jgi:excinuclease ABC subunit C